MIVISIYSIYSKIKIIKNDNTSYWGCSYAHVRMGNYHSKIRIEHENLLM
jgi:hypothetical protein